ncbi:hypothetical protein FRC17_006950, partial [Serendipita sp. 399]
MSMAMDPITKIEIAKQKKETADGAFKKGDLQAALLGYHEAMMYLHGIDKNMLNAMTGATGGASAVSPVSTPADEAESVETDGIKKEKKDGLDPKELGEASWFKRRDLHVTKVWSLQVDRSTQALSKNEKNYKAQFRKGKAQGELGYVEKALATLEDLLQKDDSDKAGISAEIARIKAADREREKKHNQKFKGFLNRKPANSYDSVSSTPSHASSTSIQSTDTSVSAASEASTTGSIGTVPGSHAVSAKEED